MTFPNQTLQNISLTELAQIRRDYAQTWPEDLVEDLEDSDPHIFEETQRQKTLLAEKCQAIRTQQAPELIQEDLFDETSELVQKDKTPPSLKKEKIQPSCPVAPVFAPDTLVARGWNNMQIKGRKNWADFENLMYLYALGKLFTAETIPAKAQQDKKELTYVVEEFDRLKHPKRKKHASASQRLASFKTYVAFGKRTIDASCETAPSSRAWELHELERECSDAMENNIHNGLKLERAYHIARRVLYNLRTRYKSA